MPIKIYVKVSSLQKGVIWGVFLEFWQFGASDIVIGGQKVGAT